MKPPPFEYYYASEPAEALALLAEHGDDGKVLAGGQSLVPLLNLRIARPSCLVDINGLHELDYVRRGDGGCLFVGALTRQSTLEHSPELAADVPLLVEAVRHVGHIQVRNRGTVGGSVAHADPAAEIPAALAALDARFHLASRRGTRRIGCEEFFLGIFTTALAPDELLTAIEIPPPASNTRSAFCELARRHGDFALGGAAVLLTVGPTLVCERASIALVAAAATPTRAAAAEASLVGRRVDAEAAREAARLAVADIAPWGDIHASAAFRRHVVQELVRRALMRASLDAEVPNR
jgi:CO/xanthine dehydrogenase FAD-binding subunit